MAHPRRFRFGAEMMGPFDGMSWAESARELESLGYSTLFAPDHFHEGFGPITAMATAAMATTTLIVATAVFAADFRHPAVLARELASIDVLSQGRLEVGIGAGYNPLDYSRSGIALDPPKVRVDRLIEHTHVLKGLWSDGPFTFEGDHYRIGHLEGTPKPCRPGGPKVFIAGGGKRLLRFAAATADIVGINASIPAAPDASTARDALPSSIDEKVRWIREAAGDRYDDLEFNAWLSVAKVTDDALSVGERLSSRFGASPEDVLAAPTILVGSVSEIADRLHARRERWGYSYMVIQGPSVHEFAPVVALLAGT